MSTTEQLPLYPQHPLILGLAAAPALETTLARELTPQLNATLLPLDFCYYDSNHLAPEARAKQNFDHPDSIESDLLTEHVTTQSASI